MWQVTRRPGRLIAAPAVFAGVALKAAFAE
jgi:hypothetical protein